MTKMDALSMTIDYYVKNNRANDLKKYFNSLEDIKVKHIIDNEISNKTLFSKSELCAKLYKKIYKVNINSEDILPVKKILKKEINNKKVKVGIGFIISVIIIVIGYVLVGYCYYIITYYNNHVYPNIYLDNKLVSGYSYEELSKVLVDNDNVVDKILVFKNDNNDYPYSYKDIGIYTNKTELESKIINSNNKLKGYQKLFKIFFDGKQSYEFIYEINEETYTNFLNDLRSKVNVGKQTESFKIVNGSIEYIKGVNGFVLNEDNLRDSIINSIKDGVTEIELQGEVEIVKNSLNTINKKVSTFTTYYNESQGRAKNIRNAVSKINGKILYPGDVFSFYKAAGPYNGSRGYIFYAKDVGSGVCQVSTTIYNAALLLNLPIVARSNHGDMVYYVDYGMDATVYGSSVDMKFRNSSNYPIYIEAHASGGTLTVSFWSNENIVEPGYSYKPRVEHMGGLSYKTYLDTYYNGNKVSTKYLNSSYYIKGK